MNISFMSPDDRLAGFVRLSLPGKDPPPGMSDLDKAALIREVHVYGQSSLSVRKGGAAQYGIKRARKAVRCEGKRI
jgi:histone acetyltransferase (RNA polymerase elongator complex component)